MQQEHDIAEIIAQQQVNGWEFDYPRAVELKDELEARKAVIYGLVRPYLHAEVDRSKTPVANPWLKDGSRFQERVKKYWGNEVVFVAGPYSPVGFTEPNLGSHKQLKAQLAIHGWRPVNFTKPSKTFPQGQGKLDEESFEGLELGDTGQLLMEYFKASQRSSTLLGKEGGGWLAHAYPVAEGRWRINAKANPCGTNTHRMTHSGVVNVPKADPSVYYGKEFRGLFRAAPGYVVVGADASQVELRMLASYMGDEQLIFEITQGDFHTVIWNPIKPYCASRSNAKNIEYAFMYGASDAKLGTMCDFNPKKWSMTKLGAEVRRLILESIPALSNLMSVVQSAARRGWMHGIDGLPVYMRRSNGKVMVHKALNTLLQHAGSVVVKRATVYQHKWAKEAGIVFKQVGMFHDEVQLECLEKDAEALGNFFVDGLAQAGKDYELDCPLDGEWKVGSSWADTH